MTQPRRHHHRRSNPELRRLAGPSQATGAPTLTDLGVTPMGKAEKQKKDKDKKGEGPGSETSSAGALPTAPDDQPSPVANKKIRTAPRGKTNSHK